MLETPLDATHIIGTKTVLECGQDLCTALSALLETGDNSCRVILRFKHIYHVHWDKCQPEHTLLMRNLSRMMCTVLERDGAVDFGYGQMTLAVNLTGSNEIFSQQIGDWAAVSRAKPARYLEDSLMRVSTFG